MNADLKRVRDTSIDDGPSPLKRRATGVSSPPPVVNIEDAGIEEWQRVMETHRKEAIYRQMLEDRRRAEFERQRADEIKLQEQRLQASVQAVEICWNQLVEAVRTLCPEGDLDFKASIEPALDPQLSHEQLQQALDSRLPATTQLIQTVVKAGPSGRHASNEELYSRCMKVQAESSSMRANAQHLEAQIATLTDRSHILQRELSRAQKALDRQRMDHDKRVKELESQKREGGASPAPEKANGSGHATPNGKLEDDVKPFPAGPSSILLDTSELDAKLESRFKSLEALRVEHTTLRQEYDRLKLMASHPSEAVLRESPFFQVYLQQLATQMDLTASLQQRCDTAEKQVDQLRGNNYEFQQAMIAEARAETEVLRQQHTRKDADLARIRGQRDDATAELAERKAKEVDKMNHTEEMEKLAKAREERIRLLSSEVLRLKGKLGAQSGSAGYLTFLRGEGGIDGDYVRNLETKLEEMEGHLSTLRDQIAQSSNGPAPDDTRVELESAKRALSRFERILGPDADAAEDVKQLAQRLETSDKENASLRLQTAEAEASTNALYTEVEGLSKLWEGVERTVHSKVFDLKDNELKMGRLATEKAKADNKYFQAMRAKEAIEAECKTAQRSVEKQLKMLEKAQEVERALSAQIGTHDKGLTTLKSQALDLQRQLATVTSEKTQLETRLQQSQSALADAQSVMRQRVADHASEKAAREQLEEQASTHANTIQRLKEREELFLASGGKALDEDLKKRNEQLWKAVKCSACGINLKSQVLTTCFHTFCKECIDTRLETRQRKCPACNQSFAKQDVHTIYFQ